MGAYPGKYVIGLTGNIATGKSVVRKMLEHLGAYGIDADALGHRVISKGAPGYQLVIDVFGNWILADSGEIERAKLAKVVFNDPKALKKLEQIIHPLVTQTIDILINRSKQKIIVIEAIKLLESNLRSLCDSIWVTDAPKEIQLNRLINKRKMSHASAHARIAGQQPQALKKANADVIINSENSFEDTWQQVIQAWHNTISITELDQNIGDIDLGKNFTIKRARPEESGNIVSFLSTIPGNNNEINNEDIIAGFGQKAYLLIKKNEQIHGVIGWQVENLVARITDIYIEKHSISYTLIKKIINEIEKSSKELLCEVALLFLPLELANYAQLWDSLGYKICSIQSLGVRAWQEAAIESFPAGAVMRYKKLRQELILKPV